MNLEHILTDSDLLSSYKLAFTACPEQPCFQCEKAIATPNHYQVAVTGADSHRTSIQMCIICFQNLHSQAYERRAKAGTLRQHMKPLTRKELQLRLPIQLGSIFAPKAPTTDPNFFTEDPNAL